MIEKIKDKNNIVKYKTKGTKYLFTSFVSSYSLWALERWKKGMLQPLALATIMATCTWPKWSCGKCGKAWPAG